MLRDIHHLEVVEEDEIPGGLSDHQDTLFGGQQHPPSHVRQCILSLVGSDILPLMSVNVFSLFMIPLTLYE